ncbi:MAG: hypothetical protein FWC57_01670 [Endomicrobia bacterium]|nr:hypothetical protein [Endomicrobiia bacterium]
MKLIRSIFALIALPAVAAGAYTLVTAFLSFAGNGGREYIPFWLGIFCYMVFQIAFYKPLRTYVFGHELSHAIAGIISGARIKKFTVGQESGSVVLTKDNIWITLAPYFFPIYTIILVVIYVLAGWFTDIRLYYPYFLFLAGLTIAFHIALTIYILSIGQPDLKVYGVFFSYVAMIAVNVVVFSVLMAFAFPHEIGLGELAGQMAENIAGFYFFIYGGISEIVTAFRTTE